MRAFRQGAERPLLIDMRPLAPPTSGRSARLPRRRFLAHFGLTLASPAVLMRCGQAAEAALPPVPAYLQRAGYYAIKLDRDENNHFLLEARLGPQKTTLLVDTGWTFTSAARRLLRDFATVQQLGTRLEPALAGLDWKSAHLVGTLALDQAEFTNQPVFETTTDTGDAKRWEGILGMDFLARSHAIIDCLTGWICVRGAPPSDAVAAAVAGTLDRSGYAGCRLERTGALVFACGSRLNGKPVSLLVDTGATYSVLHRDTADRLKLARQEGVGILRGVGSIGSVGFDTARVRTWEVGEAVAKGVGVGVTNLAPWFAGERTGRGAGDKSAPAVPFDGLLGADHLYQFGAIIDCHHHRLWVDRDRMAGRPR